MYIHETAVIYPNVKLGNNVYIGANCIIGAPAEHKKYWGEQNYSVVIEDDVVIHGNVTIDAGTESDTLICNGAWLLKGCYIGHDCIISPNVTICANANLGGYVKVDTDANIGMGACIHQGVTIPFKTMIGMGTIVTKKSELKAMNKYVGNPARYIGENVKG